jgi:hypothetical protein
VIDKAMKKQLLVAAILLVVCACHREEGRGGISAEQDRQLDNAAAMLDAQTIEPPADFADNAVDQNDGSAAAPDGSEGRQAQ